MAAAAVLVAGGCVGIRQDLGTGPDDYEGTPMGGDPAPDFRLTNQHGQSVALSDFRGKVVALVFFDPRCIDVCPLTSLELRHAAEQLGAANAGKAAFLAVNVNERATAPAEVAAYTEQHRMSDLPNWNFLTGAPPQLAAVAADYFVYAVGTAENRVDHTSGMFVIDAEGRRQLYLNVPPEQAATTRPGDILARQMKRYMG